MKYILILILLLLDSIVALSQDLKLGDPAPPLRFENWIQGQPSDDFKKGKIYVLDFWSISCEDCPNYFRHLTKLSMKYGKKVRFIGVNVAAKDNDVVISFLNPIKSKIRYSVAVDNGYMEKKFLRPLTNMIPTTVIVGKTGVIEWAGSSLGIEDVLQKIIADKWDVQVFKTQISIADSLDSLQMTIGKSPDWLSIHNKIKGNYADVNADSVILSWQYPYYGTKKDMAIRAKILVKYVEKYVPKLNPRLMNVYAWDVFKCSEDKSELQTAANWLKSDAASIYPEGLDTYANILHKLEKKSAAIKIQKKALKIIDQDNYVDDLALTYYKILTNQPTWEIGERYYYINNKLAWSKVAKSLKSYTIEKADSLVFLVKTTYMKKAEQWDDLAATVNEFWPKGAYTGYALNSFAWDIFQNSKNQNELNNALKWSERSFEDYRYVHFHYAFYDTKANILHKLGRSEEAVRAARKALELCPEKEKEDYKATLAKIQKGDKTW